MNPATARPDFPEQRALTASTLALVVAVGGVAMFLPPLVKHTVEMPLRAVAAGLAMACVMVLHWVFLGLAAQRMQRSVAGWVSLSVLLFPVGSATALILLGWFADERRAPRAAV
ncbi:MAG: hypothetical protein Q8R98_13295 [Rubrivivax sp.]|nr:hypothetical protein [Rubrivivax sp.]MDP3223775.1 hypothetical protein [Rubrivivax sp.]MDP3612825.1 hypothetical protein [Rubrivivax sp.]